MWRTGCNALTRSLRQAGHAAEHSTSKAPQVAVRVGIGQTLAFSASKLSSQPLQAGFAAAAAGSSQNAHTSTAPGDYSPAQSSGWSKYLFGGVIAAGVSGLGFALAEDEAEHGLHPPQYPWSHNGWFSSYDHAAIRRGHQVYAQVCAACHSVEQLHYRNMVGVAYTEEEMKEMAAESEFEDGPNDEGEMFTRPGRLSDHLPRPYANEEAARYANGGAYPPDLSLITKARHDGQNYVFSLLLGYRDPPAGVNVREGLHYNPYFVGGAIAMPKMLADEGTEYDDGTEATESQQAKDVTTFLAWAAEPEHDERKLAGAKWLVVLTLVYLTAIYYKRWKWAPIKSRRVVTDAFN